MKNTPTPTKKIYSAEEWEKEMYKGEWSDCEYNRDRVECGEIPEWMIGRRTTLELDERYGTVLITEGLSFFIDDEKGREVARFHGVEL